MRLLFVQPTSWVRELGAPQVLIELGVELERLGHEVDHFCADDAFPRLVRNRFVELVRPPFSHFARRHVVRSGLLYDVIDAQEGELPFSKAELGFPGLLVARSVGLSHAYREFEQYSLRRWPDQPRGKAVGEALRAWRARRQWPDFERSWREADLVNVPTPDEVPYLAAAGVQEKTVVLPNGLSTERREALRAAAAPPAERLRRREIAFIGSWYPRKGSLDLGEIVMRVRERVPEARFLLLGTYVSEDRVLRDLGLGNPEWIRVVPSYASDDLPGLLAGVAAAVQPSYVEGFGLAVLEQLTAGVPCVAYDAPGPREMLRGFEPGLMAPRGDTGAIADRLAAILRQDLDSYAALADRCRAAAAGFSWEEIARRTAAIYESALNRLTRAGEPPPPWIATGTGGDPRPGRRTARTPPRAEQQ
jgi:glycosyltransferase involved in cell wall biosynthesis